eukprot:TRINITY_DN2140_c0_g1_i2.p1 TRINITY_DN2140_c0_g1~~TRINITY_DN2140_c0_g1_i2.p1  ORF type:complete len:213 (-),score=42.45 TRINITY_DN2140_c0_g1_i2:186-824(-)
MMIRRLAITLTSSNARLLSSTARLSGNYLKNTQPYCSRISTTTTPFSRSFSTSTSNPYDKTKGGKEQNAPPIPHSPLIEMAQVEEYSHNSFTINRVQYFGSVIVFPNMVFSWDCKRFEDLKEEHFAIFPLFYPNIKYLIIGCGPEFKRLPSHLVEYLDKRGIVAESMSTFHALGTFNIVSEEGRAAAACLITNEKYDVKTPISVIKDKDPKK